jgi:demethylspheroidene O-methyltransferase
VRVVHDHDDERVLALLRAVRAALPPGGTLLLAEPMAGTPGAQAMGDAYFGFYLLAMGSGRPRTPQRLGACCNGPASRRCACCRPACPCRPGAAGAALPDGQAG